MPCRAIRGNTKVGQMEADGVGRKHRPGLYCGFNRKEQARQSEQA